MKQLNLEEIREVELDLLKKFKQFCKENQIQYFLSNGTLLGAIKYKGFIPWDDDVDVLVPRDDYNRLLALFEDDDKYCLMSYEKNKNYLYPFAKLCDMSTRKEENNINNGVTLGIDIDIFPLDFWSDDINKAKSEVKRIKRNIFCLSLAKMNKADSKKLWKRFIKAIVICFCKLYGSQYFLYKIVKECNQNCAKKHLYIGCKAWCIYGEKEIVPVEVFRETVEVKFEGEKYQAPIGYDVYLQSLYGDYAADPPLEKQKTHHNFRAYRL